MIALIADLDFSGLFLFLLVLASNEVTPLTGLSVRGLSCLAGTEICLLASPNRRLVWQEVTRTGTNGPSPDHPLRASRVHGLRPEIVQFTQTPTRSRDQGHVSTAVNVNPR